MSIDNINAIDFNTFKFLDDEQNINNQLIANEIHIIFITVLPKDYFMSLFLDICEGLDCSDYIIDDIIKICIDENTISSVNCLIWLLYIGYIKTEYQYQIIEEYLYQLNNNKINKLIEDSKNNKLNNKYYKNLLKIAGEREF